MISAGISEASDEACTPTRGSHSKRRKALSTRASVSSRLCGGTRSPSARPGYGQSSVSGNGGGSGSGAGGGGVGGKWPTGSGSGSGHFTQGRGRQYFG